MKKIIFAVSLLAAFGLLLFAQAKPSEQRGRIIFEALKKGDSLKIKLDLTQDRPVIRPVKAVKVTCEPSNTVIFLLTDGTLAPSQEETFLNKLKPAGRMDLTEKDPSGKPIPGSSLVEPKANHEMAFPKQIASDNAVKIEILVLKNGSLETQLVSKVPVKTTLNMGVTAYYSVK